MVKERANGAEEAGILEDMLGEGGTGRHRAADDGDVDFHGTSSLVSAQSPTCREKLLTLWR